MNDQPRPSSAAAAASGGQRREAQHGLLREKKNVLSPFLV
jgi:hypothetical protein